MMEGGLRNAEFLSINPHGQVPVIVFEDGQALSQSNALIGHLTEGSHLLQSKSFARVKVMQWLFWEQYSHEPCVAVCRLICIISESYVLRLKPGGFSEVKPLLML